MRIVRNQKAANLFRKLSKIEQKHQDRVFDEYSRLTGNSESLHDFETKVLPGVVEGGLTTQEYESRFLADPESVENIVELAMSIEAQALDLYQRSAGRSENPESRKALTAIAGEEHVHLRQLRKLIDELVG